MNSVTTPAKNSAIQNFAVEGSAYTTALESYHAPKHPENYPDGKIRIGEIELRDRHGFVWQVKVRWASTPGHYLTFQRKSDETQAFRATADGYEPGAYYAITPHEWEIFAMLLDDRHNYALRSRAQSSLNRLIESQ
ncbi:MAG TPA: hypothetical protein V6C57_18585 [Coleofasciculaceae cyanobacterium]